MHGGMDMNVFLLKVAASAAIVDTVSHAPLDGDAFDLEQSSARQNAGAGFRVLIWRARTGTFASLAIRPDLSQGKKLIAKSGWKAADHPRHASGAEIAR